MMAAHKADEPRPPDFPDFYTNTFDRYFISVVPAFAFGSLYLSFLAPLGFPPFPGASL